MKFLVYLTLGSLAAVVQGSILPDFVDDCANAHFAADTCAVLFDDDDCEGWERPVPEGYTALGYWKKNDAESVVVKAGCTFIGYDEAGEEASARGRSIVVDASNKRTNVQKNFRGKNELDEKISSTECRCGGPNVDYDFGGEGLPSGGRPGNQAVGNAAKGECLNARFAAGVSCIAYDDQDCETDSWDAPLFFRSGDSRSFSLLEALSNFKYKNAIESVSVKAGCVLEVYDHSNFSNDKHKFVAPRNADLHVTLAKSQEANVISLNRDIESLKCYC